MQYTKFGRTGLDVSRICLGCMSYGVPERGNHPWTPRRGRQPAASSAGGRGRASTSSTPPTSTPTAPARRSSAGRWREFADRDEIVLATKVHGRMRDGPNGAGLSRKAIMTEIDAQPAPARHRLRRPLPDPPVGSDDADRGDDRGAARRGQGRARPATSAPRRCGPGSSPRRCTPPTAHGWTRFVSMQDHYNLLYREEEREMLPLCADQGIGVIPWSPLARGRLTRDWDATTRPRARPTSSARRSTTTPTAPSSSGWPQSPPNAASRGRRSRWPGCCAKPVVTAPIVGATKPTHLDDAVAAVDLDLDRRRGGPARGALHAARGRRLRLTAGGPLSSRPRADHAGGQGGS